MEANLYIDKGSPFISVHPQKLTDGSIVWNLHVRGGETQIISCLDEKRADVALSVIASALTIATGETPLIL